MTQPKEWRAAQVETRARGFGPNEWIRRTDKYPFGVTLHPGDTVKTVSRSIASNLGYKPEDVRLVIIDR